MGPASFPTIVLSLSLALLGSKSGVWDGPHTAQSSETPVTAVIVADQASPVALEAAYCLGESRLHVRVEVERYSFALATLEADAEVLGIRAEIQHDTAGLTMSFDASDRLRSFAVRRLFSLFRISA